MSNHIHCNELLPDDRIVKFILEHHVMTLATSSTEGDPWCAACFYLYLPGENWFVFTTDDETRHGREMGARPKVAANIALETNMTGKIRGVQITGVVRKAAGKELTRASVAFLKRFPVSMLKQTNLWILAPDHIKMTDNRLGFGKKILWFPPDRL
jgi:uncharacterized protein